MIDLDQNTQLKQGVNFGLDYSKISKAYKIAKISFILPIIFLALGILDAITFHLAGAFFGSMSVFSAAPGGLIGLIFSVKGLIYSRKLNHNQYADTGIAFILFGLIYILVGLLGAGFILIRFSE